MTVLTVVGDTVLDVDVTGDADRVGPEGCLVLDAGRGRQRPGAAALAATFAVADGAEVRLVTALADDDEGRWLRRRLVDAGVEVIDLGSTSPTPQKWRIRHGDRTLVRVDHHCRRAPAPVRTASVGDLAGADAVLVADYGRGVAAALVDRSTGRALVPDVPVVWDPHPRGPDVPRGLDLVVPNEEEARRLVGVPDLDRGRTVSHLADRWGCAVAVTCGADGAVVACGDAVVTVPGRVVPGDTCGAGDRFAARVAVERAAGRDHVTAVAAGVAAASHFVATGLAEHRADAAVDAIELSARVRARGGTVVAAGGCFDLLHAGHVELLEAARALGDCLVVCLNSNRSIRRLKGPQRPIVDERDRRRLLEALQCVDAVAVFDESTPLTLLDRLRPNVFAKGADYAAADLPERELLAGWGGTVAILPLAGERSTSRLIDLVRERAS